MGEVLSQHKMGKVPSQHKLEVQERGRRRGSQNQNQSSSLLHERSGPIVGEPGCRMLVMAIIILASVVKAVLPLLHIVLLLLLLLGVGLVTMMT